MTDIEKMYEDVGVELVADVKFPAKDANYNVSYPPFTAKKQLELIKWLIRNKRLFIRKADYSSNYYMDVTYNRGNGVDNPKFENCLTSLINDLWQDLTDQEKEEIRNILND